MLVLKFIDSNWDIPFLEDNSGRFDLEYAKYRLCAGIYIATSGATPSKQGGKKQVTKGGCRCFSAWSGFKIFQSNLVLCVP